MESKNGLAQHRTDHFVAPCALGGGVLFALLGKHTLLDDAQRSAMPIGGQGAVLAELQVLDPRQRVALLVGDLGGELRVTASNDAAAQRLARSCAGFGKCRS